MVKQIKNLTKENEQLKKEAINFIEIYREIVNNN